MGRARPDKTQPGSQDARLQLAKILESGVFEKSERKRRFLRFIVELTLAGRQSEIGEYNLGLEVYDRSAEFDPRLSPIVRVDAARLRSKLREYYESEGRDDLVRIEIPKGKYVPVLNAGKASRPSDREDASLGQRSRKAIALMPFLDLSPQESQWQFGRGLPEELALVLSHIAELSVVSSISVLALKRRRLDVPRIGQRLGLDAIIEGSVRQWNRRLRIVVRLTEASTGYQLWSAAFEGKVGDLLAQSGGQCNAHAEETLMAPGLRLLRTSKLSVLLLRLLSDNDASYSLIAECRWARVHSFNSLGCRSELGRQVWNDCTWCLFGGKVFAHVVLRSSGA